MAGIRTTIQIQDRMSAVLNNITRAMSVMVNTFENAQVTAGQGFETGSWDLAREEVIQASAAVAQYQEELERVQNTPIKTPEQPVWNSISSQPTVSSSGAERWASEFQVAEQMAQQLYERQQTISAQARNLRVTPPGMLNDVAALENRMQSLTGRIQQINSIPVDLRTDQTNNELIALQEQLSNAVETQNQLTAAMDRMDISEVNVAYQKLNSIMDSTERDIRDNFAAQEQFNQSIEGGQKAATGLEGSIKRYAAMLLSVATAGKAISLADQVSQTTSRLELMNDGLQTTEELNQKIFASAQRARAPYMDTASSIAKMGLNAGNAFSSNDELIAFMEQVNKQFVIGGASAQEQSNAMVQLSQSMAAGALRGEELNSILDAAPGIARTIEQAMGWAEGSIKQYAEKGAVSAQVVKNSLLEMADETNAKFDSMPMTFGQVMEKIKNQSLMAFDPALKRLSSVAQSEGFQSITNGVSSGIQILSSGAVQAMDMLGQATLFTQENLWWLIPAIGSVTAAMVAYKGAVLTYNAVQGISNTLKSLSILWSAAHGAAITSEMAATTGMTTAQLGFNASLLACPITWVIVGIMALIAAVYIVIGAINKFEGTSISATGVIAGAFSVLGAFLYNSFVMPSWNVFAEFANFIGNFMNNPVAAVKVLFYDLAIYVVGKVAEMAHAIESLINNIPGAEIDLTSKLDSIKGNLEADVSKIKNESGWKEYVAKKDKIEYGEAYKTGYEFGSKIEDRAKHIFGGKGAAISNSSGYEFPSDAWEGIKNNTGNTAGNTAKMADAMDMMDEDLKYMRDAAEQEIINRFTLADLKVEVTNHNTLKTETDFDDVNRRLTDDTAEALAAFAEGAHI